MAEVPIDRDWAWCIVIGAFINTFFVIGGFKTVGIIFVHVLEMYQASQSLTAWMIGLMSFGLSLYALPATVIGQKYSFRASIILGGSVMSLGFFITAFATNVYFVICVLGIMVGFGNGFLYTPSVIMVGKYFERHRSLAIGVAAAGGSFGQLVIPFLTRSLLDNYSFQGCMLIYSAVTLNTLIAGFLFRPHSFYKRPRKPKDSEKVPVDMVAITSTDGEVVLAVTPSASLNSLVFRSQIQDSLTSTPMTTLDDTPVRDAADIEDTLMVPEGVPGGSSRHSAHYSSTGSLCMVPENDEDAKDKFTPANDDSGDIRNLEPIKTGICCSWCRKHCQYFSSLFDRDILIMKAFWVYFVATLIGNAGYIDQFLFIPPYAKELNIDKGRSAIILSVSGIADLCGRISGGFLNNLKLMKSNYFVSVCLIVAAMLVGISLFFPYFATLITHAVALGCLGGMYIALFPVVLMDIVGMEKFPSAFALTMMGAGFGNLPLPAIFGKISDATGSYFIPFSILNGMVLASAILFLVIPLIQRLDSATSRKLQTSKQDDAEDGKLCS